MCKSTIKVLKRIIIGFFFCLIIFYNAHYILQNRNQLLYDIRDDRTTKNSLHVSNTFYYSLDWYKHSSGLGQQRGRGIAIDSNDNIYQTGSTDTGPYGGLDVILIKRSRSGIHLWNRTWGGGGSDTGLKIALDHSDDVYVIDINNLTKLDKYGSLKWSEPIGISAQGITMDSVNFIYVVGYKGSPNNIVLTKFNSLGTKLWEKAWVTSSTDRGIDLVTDSQNNIYIAGSSSSVGSIIIKCDSSGNQISNFTFQGTPKALGIDSTDSLYLGGDLSGSIIIAKFNNLGGHIWNRIWMGVGGTNCKDLILDSNGNIFLTGTMSGSSATYAYILTYDNNGNLIWTTSWGFDFPLTSTWNEGWGIASDSFDNLYLSGYSDFINWAYDESFLLKYVYGRLPQPFSLFSDADTPDVDGRFNLFWDPSIGAKSYSVYRYSYDITEINTSLVLLADHSAISPYPVSARNGTFYYIIVAHNETGNRRSNCVSVLVEIPYDAPGASNNFVIILLIIIIVVIVGVSGIVSYYQVVKKRGKFKPKRFKIKKERVIYIKKQILEIGTKFDRLQITEIAEICEEDSELISSIIKEMIKEGEIYAEYFEPSNTVNFDQQTIINEIDSLMASYKEWEIGKGKKK